MTKIIKLQPNPETLIVKAKHNDRLAQKGIYEAYAPALLSVCRLYVNDLHFAEDVLMKGFLNIFTHLKNYREQQHFYSWMRKIMVNECIDFLRSRTHKVAFSEWSDTHDSPTDLEGIDFSYTDELQQLLDKLPNGCRAVFSLYVFDDYSHKEIAETLAISIGTSKSQLAYAKKIIKEQFKNRSPYEQLEK